MGGVPKVAVLQAGTPPSPNATAPVTPFVNKELLLCNQIAPFQLNEKLRYKYVVMLIPEMAAEGEVNSEPKTWVL